MKTLTLKHFMKKYNLKKDTMNESQLQKILNYPKYPRDSKIYSYFVYQKDLLIQTMVVWADLTGPVL